MDDKKPAKLYALPDHVISNIIAIVNNADIKGGQAPVIIEIAQCLDPKNGISPDAKEA